MKTGLLLMLFVLPSVVSAQVAVVVHKTAPVDTLDAQTLLDIYSLEETKWQDGSRIVLFDLKGEHDLKRTFYSVLGRRPDDMKRGWLRIILSGEARSPTLLPSPAAVLEQVASTPGAIGYVPLASVTDAVKVVATIP